jgi:hypothetical protein
MKVHRFGISSPFSAVRFADGISRKMGIFRAFRGKGWRNFSTVQTVWRSTQSGANLSPANSLITGKITGNLRDFKPKNRSIVI